MNARKNWALALGCWVLAFVGTSVRAENSEETLRLLYDLVYQEQDSAYKALTANEMKAVCLLESDGKDFVARAWDSWMFKYSSVMLEASEEDRGPMADRIIELLKDPSKAPVPGQAEPLEIRQLALTLLPITMPPGDSYDRICRAMVDIYDAEPPGGALVCPIVANLSRCGTSRPFVTQKLCDIITSPPSEKVTSFMKRSAISSLSHVVPDPAVTFVDLWEAPNVSWDEKHELITILGRDHIGLDASLRILIDLLQGDEYVGFQRDAYNWLRSRELQLEDKQGKQGLAPEEALHLGMIQEATAGARVRVPDDEIPEIQSRRLEERLDAEQEQAVEDTTAKRPSRTEDVK